MQRQYPIQAPRKAALDVGSGQRHPPPSNPLDFCGNDARTAAATALPLRSAPGIVALVEHNGEPAAEPGRDETETPAEIPPTGNPPTDPPGGHVVMEDPAVRQRVTTEPPGDLGGRPGEAGASGREREIEDVS